MQKDNLCVALISESVNAHSPKRRVASLILVDAIRAASPGWCSEDVLKSVAERATEDVAQEARLLVRDLGV